MSILLESILLYLLCGLCSGFIAGMFGVGGGLIIVPALLWLFHFQGFDASYSTHLAIGTSLAVIMITSISSIKAHHAKNAVRWDILKRLAVGLVIGSLAGAAIAKMLPSQYLQLIIGLFAWWVALDMLRKTLTASPKANHAESSQSAPIQMVVGGVIGTASAIFGIGGGTLTVPYLSRLGVPMVQAVGTAAAAGFPIAIAGAIGFMLFGSGQRELPQYAIGFVYVPAFLGISLTSVLSAQYGAKVAHGLPSHVLKRLFSVLLFVVGCVFLGKAWHYFI